MKFFELLKTINYAQEKIENQFGEIFDDDVYIEAEIDDSIDFWSNYLLKKYKEIRAYEAASEELAKSYKARAEMLSRQAEQKAELIKLLIQHTGQNLKTPAGTASLSKEGKKSVVIDVELSMIPREFIAVKESADKTAIKKALEAGQEVNGARIVIGPQYVTIR